MGGGEGSGGGGVAGGVGSAVFRHRRTIAGDEIGVGEDGPMGRMVHLCFLGIFLINLNIKIYKKHNFKSLIPIITTIIDLKRIVFYAFLK